MPEERTDDLVGRRLALYAYLEPLLSGRRVLEIEARSDAARRRPANRLSTCGRWARGWSPSICERPSTIASTWWSSRGGRAGPATEASARCEAAVEGGRAIIATSNADRGGRGRAPDGVGYDELVRRRGSALRARADAGRDALPRHGDRRVRGRRRRARASIRAWSRKAVSRPSRTWRWRGRGGAALATRWSSFRSRRSSRGWRAAALRRRLPAPAARGDRGAARAPAPRRRGSRRARRRGDGAAARAHRGGRGRRQPDAERRPRRCRRWPSAWRRACAARCQATRARRSRRQRRARRGRSVARRLARPRRVPPRPSSACEEMGGSAPEARRAGRGRASAWGWPTRSWRAPPERRRSEDEAKVAASTRGPRRARQGAGGARRARRAPREREAGSGLAAGRAGGKLTAHDRARGPCRCGARSGGQGRAARSGPPGVDADRDEARASCATRSDEFHKAATVHVDEITELKASVAEQAALVAELEDAVQSAEARAAASEAGSDPSCAGPPRLWGGRSAAAVAPGGAGRQAAALRARAQVGARGGRHRRRARRLGARARQLRARSSSSRSARAATTATTTTPRRSWTRWPPMSPAPRRPTTPSRAVSRTRWQIPAARDPPARRAGRRAPTLRCAVALRDRRIPRGAGRGLSELGK